MPAESSCQYLGVGTIFEVTIQDYDDEVVDVSPATTILFTFRKPNGTTVSMDGEFVTDGQDGKVKYVSTSGDLDAVGTCKLQVYIAMPGVAWRTEVGSFNVKPNLSSAVVAD